MSRSIFSNNFSESLANLATAPSADRATVATLTDTVSTLSSQIANAQAKLVSSLLTNQKLLELLSGSEQRTSGGAEGASTGAKKRSLDGPSDSPGPEPYQKCYQEIYHGRLSENSQDQMITNKFGFYLFPCFVDLFSLRFCL